ncbi:MAG: glutamate-1-semialdehyde 2,1-aminomutase [Selenomonadaceae bacterium]|nr:glutamate-1-semialdehyde 2,1-aminomutase [Selenomonadaceae bacterium]
MLNLEKSAAAFTEAKSLMPGGVNSPVRSYRSMGSTPPFIAKAKGSKIYDIDGNEYIDYVLSWGPMVVGHAHDEVIAAINEAAALGTSYGAPTLRESELAKLVMTVYPSIQRIRMVNSGTEATMSALRLARGYTKRDKIIKFVGCYHGHSDSLLVKAGSGLATFGVPDSPGVTAGVANDTITVPYNDPEALTAVMKEHGSEVAAIIVEPVAGNMGCILPKQGYLGFLRKITEEYGALLIFDEVMCGFRASLGGAQAAYGITPDITCLGKIIGGGLPVAAYGGKAEIMDCVSPAGPVYQAGTLSGNPLAMAAGIATLKILTAEPEPGQPDTNRILTLKVKEILAAVDAAAKKYGVAVQLHQAGSMFGIFFSEKDVENYADAEACDQEAFKVWFHSMLEQGIYLAPSQFETIFMSMAHSDEDIAKTIAAIDVAMKAVADSKK